MCNTGPESCCLHSCFSTIIDFRCPFVVSACTDSNMNLKSGGSFSPPCSPPPPNLAYTFATPWMLIFYDVLVGACTCSCYIVNYLLVVPLCELFDDDDNNDNGDDAVHVVLHPVSELTVFKH